MAGLGQRGQKIISAPPMDELFRRTDNTENSKCVKTEIQQSVRKQYVFSFELAEKLRELAFKERRKEVDIVREALEKYIEGSRQS